MVKHWIWVLLMAIIQTSCTRTASVSSVRWSGQGPAPVAPTDLNLNNAASQNIGSKMLVFQTQKIDGVEVEGTYYKKISEKDQDEFIGYRWMSEIPTTVRRDLILMRAQRPFVQAHFVKKYEFFAGKKIFAGPELSLSLKDAPAVEWKMVFEENDGTLIAVFFDRDVNITGQKILGSDFITATASLFPSGPTQSQIQDVLLRQLIGDRTLTSNKIRVRTESEMVALSDDKNQFQFLVDDVRFAQAQVFFYVSQALDWFEKNFNFQLPFFLDVETQKGYPEKTNTAFYYQHKIRLGDGDGEAFAQIPLDPSIVTHESLHAIIDAVSGLSFEEEGGSLNEGYADFFTAVQLKNPRMGEFSYKKAAYKRTIENDKKLSDRNGGLYHDSGIVSGLLWNLYKELDSKKALEIAWQTLLRLNPASDFEGFKEELLSVLENQDVETQKKAKAILESRGWLE